MKNIKNKGFTLIEILLVVALIAILAGIVILAINPAKQLADTRNAQRRVDVNTIINAVYQYAVDNNGDVPATITPSQTEICRIGASCFGLVDLSVLTFNGKYIVSLPIDPLATNVNGTGYEIKRIVGNRITVVAPDAEEGATISVSR
jgi:prepilin-type N-terminal cleavage/methylation domain-containing protein